MADRAPGRYKPVGYDCGMEAARDGNWISYFDHTAKVAALRKAADALADVVDHPSYCLMSRGSRTCTCGLDAALAAYRATKGAE